MKLRYKLVLLLAFAVALLAAPIAFAAQVLDDPTTWHLFWDSPAHLSVLVLFVVATLKTRLPAVVDGPLGFLASLIVGTGLGWFGMVLGHLSLPLGDSLLFGFGASIIASGGWDLIIKHVINWLRGKGWTANGDGTVTISGQTYMLTPTAK